MNVLDISRAKVLALEHTHQPKTFCMKVLLMTFY